MTQPRFNSSLAAVGAMVGILAAVAAGCGVDDAPPAPCGDPCGPTPGAVDYRVVDIRTVAGAGGEVTTTPTPLPDSPALLRYASLLRSADAVGSAGDVLADAVVITVEENPPADGKVLAAAVVKVGCGEPEEIVVEQVEGGVEVSAESTPGLFCEVADTSVVVLELPADLLPTDPGPNRGIDPPDPR